MICFVFVVLQTLHTVCECVHPQRRPVSFTSVTMLMPLEGSLCLHRRPLMRINIENRREEMPFMSFRRIRLLCVQAVLFVKAIILCSVEDYLKMFINVYPQSMSNNDAVCRTHNYDSCINLTCSFCYSCETCHLVQSMLAFDSFNDKKPSRFKIFSYKNYVTLFGSDS